MTLFKHLSPQPAVFPMSHDEMVALGYTEIDFLLVTGDAYVDHPSFGIAVIARVLGAAGYRVGIIAQPDWKDPEALNVFGRPRLGAGVTSGNIDSLVNMYTVGRRLRHDDAYSPGGVPGKRPPLATIVYTQMVKKAFPGLPVFIGGLEGSMRRLTHYDYYHDRLRPTLLSESKADLILYGMGERSVLEVAARLEKGEALSGIRGTARLLGGNDSKAFVITPDYITLESYEDHLRDKDALLRTMNALEKEMNPACGRGMVQWTNGRLLVVEPPPMPLSQEELDAVNDLPFTLLPHPRYKNERIPAFETIEFSVPAVRGCPGGCAFCGLVAHQGRFVTNRSSDSVLRQIEAYSRSPRFKGTITDIGGAAANIFGHHPKDPKLCQTCRRFSCLFPKQCPNYCIDDAEMIHLLQTVRALPYVKHVYLNSGVRLDLAVQQKELMRDFIRYHVSGHMKVAPEHLDPKVLHYMRKNPPEAFYTFVEFFERESRACGKEQYLIPLFIANHPGCGAKEMAVVDRYLTARRWSPQQVQDYIPLPMTMGAAMYYTGKAPDFTPIEVNRGLAERRDQIQTLKRKRHGPDAAKGSPTRDYRTFKHKRKDEK